MRLPLPLEDELSLADGRLRYAIHASHRRRTFSLEVHLDGSVRARVPARAPLTAVRHFVLSRASWALEKRRYFLSKPRPPQRSLAHGTELPLLDGCLFLEADAGVRDLKQAGDRLLFPAAERRLRERLERWYRRQALTYAAERIAYFAPLIGCPHPRRLRIADQKTRWGSCSARGIISLNWRLMLGPQRVMDYVIVHELCHLLHLDHSTRFWRQVAQVLPDYALQRQRLRELSASLAL